MRRLAAFVALVAILGTACPAGATGFGSDCTGTGFCPNGAARQLFVATTGSDISGNGSAGNPWATPDHARSVIRSSHFNTKGKVTVNIAAGTYQDTALALTAADSGKSAGSPVTYRSKDGVGLAQLWGGHMQGGWAVDAGSVFKTTVSAQVYTLWENGVRARLARSPNLNADPHLPAAFAPYFTATGVNGVYTQMGYSGGDFDPTGWAVADMRIFSWGTFGAIAINWFTDLAAVTSVDTVGHLISLGNGGMKFPAFANPAGGRYFVAGPRQLLDQAGEFATTSAGGGNFTLYYWPRNTPIANQTIVVPSTTDIISVVGTDATTRAKNVTFDGLDIEYSNHVPWFRYGWCCDNGSGEGHADPAYDYFATNSVFQHAGVLVKNADHVKIKNAHIARTGLAGILFTGYAQNHEVSASWIEHTGGDGITFNGNYPGEGDTSKNNLVSNNRVKYWGELDGSASGLRFSQSGSNTAEYNEFGIGPRKGIWIHGEFGVAQNINYAHDNTLTRNRVWGTAQDSGELGGCFTISFMSSTSCPSTIVNTVNQFVCDGIYAHSSMLDVPVYGIFGDNDSECQVVSNAVVSNTQGPAQGYNSSGNWVFTNVNFTGAFDDTQIDYANIGIKASHPYKTASSYTFADGFESGFGNWTDLGGTPTASTTQAHDGTHSFLQDENGEKLYILFPERIYGRASIWFYDDAADTTLDAMARVDVSVNSAGSWCAPATCPGWRALGVETGTSTTKYTLWHPSAVATSITRTTGWHNFTWDYHTGGQLVAAIDGTTVDTETGDGNRNFDKIAMGDFNGTGKTGTVYWDQVEVTP